MFRLKRYVEGVFVDDEDTEKNSMNNNNYNSSLERKDVDEKKVSI